MTFSNQAETCKQTNFNEQKIKAKIMFENAQQTTDFLKSLSHPSRLMILCRLVEGSASVTELEETLKMPQAAVSKQLSRLRSEGIVEYERNGRSIIYSLKDERAKKIVDVLYQLFCDSKNSNE